jgi:hypothetical protein
VFRSRQTFTAPAKKRWTSGTTPKINTLDRDRTCNL